MSEPIIEVRNISKRYKLGQIKGYKTFRESLQNVFKKRREKENIDYIWALKDVSFDVQQGEVLGIIGRNGVGKTTLLKILSRVTEPTKGIAKLRGRVASLLEVGTGFHPELTGRENIFLNGAILGMKRNEIQRKFDEIVAFAEVEKFIETPVKRYSSGMYVRLAFAVAAHLEQEILLVDEVLAVGDAMFQKKCLGKMRNVTREGRTVLFVSHNMGSIQRICGRCLILDGGEVSSIGETKHIIEKYMETGMSNLSEFMQESDPSKGMRLRSMKLIAEDGKCRSEFMYTESFKIVTEYDINWPVSGCQVCIAIIRNDGVHAFATSDYDTTPSLFDHRKPGSYRGEVKIPSRWLNGGNYSITAYLAGKHIYYDRAETVVFSIIEVDSPGSIYEVGWRKGVFQPILNWKTEKVISSSIK